MTTIPNEIKFSESLKPISVAGKQSSMVFLPTTAGTYTPTGNNIIRFSVNANKFLDYRNMVLKGTLTNSSANNGFLDHSASSFIQRLSVLSPSQQLLQYTDNYGRLHAMLSDIQQNKVTEDGIGSILQGYNKRSGEIRFAFSADGVYTISYVDTNGTAVSFGNLDVAAAALTTVNVFDWTFTSTAVANQMSVSYKGASTGTFLISGGAGSGECRCVGGVNFRGDQGAGTDNLAINGNALDAAGDIACFSAFPDEEPTSRNGQVITNAGSIEFEIPIINVLSSLKTYTPGMLLGGVGLTFEILLAANRDVLTPAIEASACTYTITNPSLIVPTIEYDSAVNSSLVSMMDKVGSVSLSTQAFESMIYPVANSTSSLSIPLSFKKRSIKAIYVYSGSNSAQNVRTTCGRNRLRITKMQLRNGADYYPLQPCDTDQVAFVETLRGFGRLNDLKLGSKINDYSFNATAALGGQACFSLDLESAALSFIESGLNNANTGSQLYLDLQTTGNNDILAGNVYIWCLYDETLTMMNRDVIPTF